MEKARPAPRHAPSSILHPRLLRWIADHAWAHFFLLAGLAIFLFPFVYMLATSLKTDEELLSSNWFPAIPRFQAVSPYVRPAPTIAQPAEASDETWRAVLPTFRQLARAKIDASALPAGGDSVDIESFKQQATQAIIARVVSRLNIEIWSAGVDKILPAFQTALTPDTIADALDARLSRLELRGLQLRTLDAHIHSITAGADIAATWQVESNNATLIPTSDAAIVGYNFVSPRDRPIVLRCDFAFPADPADLHKLILALKPDDSWHQVDATLDLAGTRWVSQKTKYLGTTRNQSILFQPPSFDDTTDRKRIWVPLESAGIPDASALLRNHAVLRIIITPSSTPRAILGKVIRNYSRVFDSIPFWRYVANSLILVTLATVGTLFSASFVAYAFARLNWPGRSIAFAILLGTMMIPAQVTMIPSFMIWRTVGLYNTLSPLWLPAWFGSAFFIFLMVQHMKTIPRELEEAARIDGAGALRTWAQIIMPETRPALAAIAIMMAMASWNEFMGPLIYLRDQTKFPLSLGLFALRLDNPEGGIDWTAIMAGNVLMTLPVVLIFFLFQRYFIQGMTMSGMKG